MALTGTNLYDRQAEIETAILNGNAAVSTAVTEVKTTVDTMKTVVDTINTNVKAVQNALTTKFDELTTKIDEVLQNQSSLDLDSITQLLSEVKTIVEQTRSLVAPAN